MTGLEVHDRLVVQPELAALERAVQLVAGAEVAHRPVVRVGLEHLGPCAALLLGAVHRGVGVAQQRLGRLELAARERDPDARGHEHLTLGERDRLRDRRRSSGWRAPARRLSSGTAVQSTVNSSPPKRATVSFGRIAARSRSASATSSRSPDGVPEAVVHDLEVVEVEEQDRDRDARASASASARRSRSTKSSRLGSPVERIVDRLVRDELAARPALGDVLDLAHEVERFAGHAAHDRSGVRHPHRAAVGVEEALLEPVRRDPQPEIARCIVVADVGAVLTGR